MPKKVKSILRTLLLCLVSLVLGVNLIQLTLMGFFRKEA